MIINKPYMVTRLQVWNPRYHDKYEDSQETVALLHKNKVDRATGVIIIEFTKAKHLQGQRFAILKQRAQQCAVGTNGTAPMYVVPMSWFEGWETGEEVRQIAEGLFDE